MKLTQALPGSLPCLQPRAPPALYWLPPAPLTWRGAVNQTLSVLLLPKTRSKISKKLHQDPRPEASSCSPAPSLFLLALARRACAGGSVSVQSGRCCGEEWGCGLQVCGRQGGGVTGQWVADTEALFFVRLQHVGEAEALATHVTRVWLLSCVCASMPLHIGAAGETLATDLTDIRLLPCNGGGGSRGVDSQP